MESISDKFFRLAGRSKINEQAAPNSYYVSLLESILLAEDDHVTYGDSYKRFNDDPSQYPRTMKTPTEVGIERGLKSEFPNVVAKATAMDNKQKERSARVKQEMEASRAARRAGERNAPRPLSTKLRRIGQVAVGRAARRLGLRPSR